MPRFDKTYWEDHWGPAATGRGHRLAAHPALETETSSLPIGTALDAGCGSGAEATWLAGRGWRVTGADISRNALDTAATRANAAGLSDRIEWVETDLSRWQPGRAWDLVTTSYAHPDSGQLAFYERIASWVAPGGTLLIIAHAAGHRHHDGDHPADAVATLSDITRLLPAPEWRIESRYEKTRTLRPGHRVVSLRDVIVRARRRA